MFRIAVFVVVAVSCMMLFAAMAGANEYHSHGRAKQMQHTRGGLFGWRCYSAQERRNFPDCYGGYERYYGGFHANYFRDYPGHHDGLNNDRYGWGSGWAW